MLLTEQEIGEIIQSIITSEDFDPAGWVYVFSAAIEAKVIEKIKAQGPVGVFADVNRHGTQDYTQWEQMIDEAHDGKDFIYLYRLPEGD